MGADRAVRKQRGGSVLGNDWENTVRERIQNSRVANRLIEFVLGEITLEPAQVTAALGLLKKVLPDLSQSENKTEVVHRYVARLPHKAENPAKWQQEHAPNPTIQ
jgi:hypothetical protein